MDRSVLEGDPPCIIEAMALCGYATGASEGYIYAVSYTHLDVYKRQVCEYLAGDIVKSTAAYKTNSA